jgi:adenine-specific DNA-methyltransferase
LIGEVFGHKNFVAQISFLKTTSSTGEFLGGVADYVIWFAKDLPQAEYHQLYKYREVGGDGAGHYNLVLLEDGTIRTASPDERSGRKPLPEKADLFTADQLQSASIGRQKGEGAASWFPVMVSGREYRPNAQRRWSTNEEGMTRIVRSGRVLAQKTTLRFLRKFSDFKAYALNNVWSDVGAASDKVYIVETAPRIVERCVLMTTKPGDLVLDPTCGSGTTAYVAERWGRRWITVDTSRVALTLARGRLMGARYDYYVLKDNEEGASKEGEVTGKPPVDGPFTNNIRYGFVYERAPHVTLKSIANNAEIDVIWERGQKILEPLRDRLNKVLKLSLEEWQIPREVDEKWSTDAKALHEQWWKARRELQKESDASIARNADVEFLYDRPYKARGVVRVAGPFTVESLSPHRVLPMGEDPYLEELLGAGEDLGEIAPGGRRKDVDGRVEPGHHGKGGAVITDFAQVVYENLKTAGVQNTKKGERLMLENLRPFASRSGLIQFQGEYDEKGARKRAAVTIGPEYDTVGYELVRRAAREAADLFDTLIICGFAFAPEVDDTRLNFGSLTVLKARMNQDLRMADKLKATGAGNLFVVFGEPDIVVHKLEDDMLRVEIRGMDIFDPTTGEVRSSGGKDLMNDVAAWFVDHDYDEESFFVRQAYFVGEDPYDGLKRALKTEIDETAWAELNSTVSRPFPRPEHGRICVKVINHFGDEVQKVFQV